MPINADYEYFEAEKKYLDAKTTDEKIATLEELIRKAPKHKSSENLLSELKTRLKKLKEKAERGRKVGGGKKGIKKEGYQVVLIGMPNAGKSSLLAALTNAKPLISEYPYTTREPELGMMDYTGVKAQIVDMPSVGSEFFDAGIVNTADCIVIVLERFEDAAPVEATLMRAIGKRLFVFTKVDLLDNETRRKYAERARSKRLPLMFVSGQTGEGIDELKHAIFTGMGVIRVYTKEPGKAASPFPVVLPMESTVFDVGETIRNGFSKTVKETRVTGPSAKFANQKVGLQHKLKDRDIVEFHTR